jgi:hypothetical protein
LLRITGPQSFLKLVLLAYRKHHGDIFQHHQSDSRIRQLNIKKIMKLSICKHR